MASFIPAHRSGYVYHFEIDDEKYFLSEKDVGKEFVSTRLYHGWLPKGPKENKIREKALKLTALQSDGSMVFQEKDKYHPNPLRLDPSANDGYWMPLEKCVQLFKENSPKIRILELPMGCPVYFAIIN